MFRKIALTLIEKEMQTMDVHPGGVAIMSQKAQLEPLKLLHVKAPAANILKQEMLALGGECATPAVAIKCGSEYVDVLLLGSARQYGLLLNKLAPMADWFALQEVIADVKSYLQAKTQPLVTKLADGRELTYDRVQVMGILNATPDSFYDDSRVSGIDAMLHKAEQMLSEGAAILDVGGESTRPGAMPVSLEEEQLRVVPAIKQLRDKFPHSVISIDTYHSATARQALEAGANIINDISAGEDDAGMLAVAKQYQAPIILMHKRGTPQTMQQLVKYDHVVEEVTSYLLTRAECCLQQGLNKNQLILDPGIGFAKDMAGNLALLQGIGSLTGHGLPVLMAASRKGFIGKILDNIPAQERLTGTLATTCQAVYGGAQIVRVHDVLQHVQLIRMLEAILQCQ